MKNSETFLRHRGLTVTRQRALILKSMRERHDHPDVESVFTTVRHELPELALDTVYRTLNRLAQENMILKLALPTNRLHFDGNADPHDHFLCRECESIADIMDENKAPLVLPTNLPDGASVEAMQRLFIGICKTCAAKNAEARSQD